MSNPLHICMIGTWSALDELGPQSVKSRYRARKRIPTCSWLRSLVKGLMEHPEILRVSVLVHTREVWRTHVVSRDGVTFVFVPKWEPGQVDPFHWHVPARLQLTRWLRRLNPDIVHGFGTETGYGWIATTSGYPNVVKIQGVVAELRPYLGWSRIRCAVTAWFERRTLKQAHGLVASSEWAKDWASRYRPANEIRYIPNAVNKEFFAYKTDYSRPLCVSIGTFSAFKNPQMVIEAFAAAACENANLVMIGEGPLRSVCEKLAQELGVRSRIHFTGRLSRHEVIGQLRSARCLMIGSRMDTSPNVVAEALAMGVPVVGTTAGGIPGMIRHGKDGFIVEREDFASMGKYVRDLLQDATLAKSLGEMGMRKVRRLHAAKRVVEQHVAWYHEILMQQLAEPSGIKYGS